MAKVVLGIGTSHSPLLTIAGGDWHARAEADRRNGSLTLADGRMLSYDQLVQERGEPYTAVATSEKFSELAQVSQAELDKLGEAIAEAQPDVVVIVGDDQDELYSPGNMPALAIFWGQKVIMHAMPDDLPPWMKSMAKGYAMDARHEFAGHPELALDIIKGMMDRGADLAICKDVPDTNEAGFGHAFGFPVQRLFGGKKIPIIPVMLNTYFPPNVLSANRCFDIGVMLREAIEASKLDLRVAIIASGGLSHFVVEEELDRSVVEGLKDPTGAALRALPREALLQGSSEILNWVVTAGAVAHLPLRSATYTPVRRTPAGTGIGLAFATWKK
ncbi:MAG: hypothetical protein J0J06_13765 [Sphingomonas sp.]|uniref:DODA-type extradiol aromatic ring-opening family dioxygenase n=1 Tax=Sphingomonas sp. TaxID=28214 RepID=UPI001AD492FF|nr:hypothetical protein [Sphingomonas sp.]MBN8816501.1 hypothetical protein [Sphingomonas sp.]